MKADLEHLIPNFFYKTTCVYQILVISSKGTKIQSGFFLSESQSLFTYLKLLCQVN
jgi:hypothetical protein